MNWDKYQIKVNFYHLKNYNFPRIKNKNVKIIKNIKKDLSK